MSKSLTPGLSTTSSVVAGDPVPSNCELIEVHVSELRQLFNAIDPSPFRERDVDPSAEEFITADRLSVMPVRISYKPDGRADAWQSDWPATSPAARTTT